MANQEEKQNYLYPDLVCLHFLILYTINKHFVMRFLFRALIMIELIIFSMLFSQQTIQFSSFRG